MYISVAIRSHIYGAILFAFLSINFFALPAMTTHHHNGMPMSNCPFMVGEVTLCEMNATDHIASWQAMFTILPVEFSYFALLLLALVLSMVWLRQLFDPPDTSLPRWVTYKIESHSPSFKTLLLGSAISPRAP